MTLVFIALLAALMFLYLGVPLLLPGQTDALPDQRDPVTQDLEEERDALLRAIRELEARTDLPAARRDALRSRYEAKAAKVLRALDERQQNASVRVYDARKGVRKGAAERFGLPLAALTLLGAGLGGAAWFAYTASPEVVTADGSDPALSGRELAARERAAERNPSEDTLLALADGHWQLESGERAKTTYQRVVAEVMPVPAVAYQRLGFLALQEDVGEALRYLELARNADPEDLQTLYILGEVYYANDDMTAATEAWESYLAAPGGAGDAEVQGRLALARSYAPLLEAVAENPSEASLLALANSYWTAQERARAVELYFQVLSENDPNHPVALSRVGQQLFFGGRNDDAIAVLGRAREVAPNDLPTLLFLGNAHFSLGQYQEAIDTWQAYIRSAGGPERAGRVPSLIADARERLRTGAPPPADAAPDPDAPPETAGRPGPVNVP